jgi:outer membrane protein assembly factor BamB
VTRGCVNILISCIIMNIRFCVCVWYLLVYLLDVKRMTTIIQSTQLVLAMIAALCTMAQSCPVPCARGCCNAGQTCCQPDPLRGPICCNAESQTCLREYGTCVTVSPAPPAPTPYHAGELLWAFRANSSGTHPVANVGGDVVVATTGAGLEAFRVMTGELVWTYPKRVKEHNVLQNGSFVFAAPVGFARVIEAVDASTGSLIWSTSLPDDVNAIRLSTDHQSCTPMLFVHTQDANYYPSGIYVLAAANGSILWNTTSFLDALPATVAGICAVSDDVYINGVDCMSGALVWSSQKHMSGSGSTSIFAVPSHNMFLAYFDLWSSVELVALNAHTGDIVWNHTNLFGTGNLVFSDDQSSLYTVTSNNGYTDYVDRYDLQSGALQWRVSTETNSFDNNKILAATDDFLLVTYPSFTFGLFAKNGSVAWNTTYTVSSESVSLSSNGAICYVGIDRSMVAIEMATGKQLWGYATQLGLQYAPMAVGGALIGGSQDTMLYAVHR